MFRELRRKKQLLSEEESIEILKNSTAGVLGVIGDNGYPYAVPMSYTYKNNKIYMHSAMKGHKIDGILNNNKVSFAVTGKDHIVQETFTTHYNSVVVFGLARIIEDSREKKIALEELIEKYSPDYVKEGQTEIKKDIDNTAIIVIDIEHLTGKQAIELVKKPNEKENKNEK